MNTIVARLTPAMPAAIATLAISGPQALQCVERFVRLSGAGLTVGTLRYGLWEVGGTGRAADTAASLMTELPTAERRATLNAEELMAERRATLEQVVLTRPEADTVEVHCHGGAAVCQALLNDLVSAGCELVPAEQVPSRQSCPLARAAEEDLLVATTDRAAAVLLEQSNGALRQAIEDVARQCLSEEIADWVRASDGLERLLQWPSFGLHLSQPWKIVLVGPPNVGKSSLLNALAGTRQAIVHHEPGTTRDWIEWSSAVDGWPVVFTDTAGIRASSESIEQAGVERSLQQLIEADLALLVIDAQLGWTDEHTRLIEVGPKSRLIVRNKVDLAENQSLGFGFPEREWCSERRIIDDMVDTCAIDGSGIPRLFERMARILVPDIPAEGTAIPFRIEQIECLRQCWELMQKGDLEGVAARLRNLLGSE